jgi:hypothetical protein
LIDRKLGRFNNFFIVYGPVYRNIKFELNFNARLTRESETSIDSI